MARCRMTLRATMTVAVDPVLLCSCGRHPRPVRPSVTSSAATDSRKQDPATMGSGVNRPNPNRYPRLASMRKTGGRTDVMWHRTAIFLHWRITRTNTNACIQPGRMITMISGCCCQSSKEAALLARSLSLAYERAFAVSHRGQKKRGSRR